MSPILRISACVAIAGSAAACAPSFQAIYEGDSRFERCYALEENPGVPMREKAECWKGWTQRYTYGQTRDRVQYAYARWRALSDVPRLPTDEAMMMAAPGVTPRVSAITAAAPTNAFAPPPKVLGDPEVAIRRVEATPTEASVRSTSLGLNVSSDADDMPSSRCQSTCRGVLATCRSHCGAKATPGAPACDACDDKYKGCMRGCFE